MGCYWNTMEGSCWFCRLEGCIAYNNQCIYEGGFYRNGIHYNKNVGCKYMLPDDQVPNIIIKKGRELKENDKYFTFMRAWYDQHPELPLIHTLKEGYRRDLPYVK